MTPISEAPFCWQSVLPFALIFYSYSLYPAHFFLQVTLPRNCFSHVKYLYRKLESGFIGILG